MQALAVVPGQAGSIRLIDRPEPQAGPGDVLVEAVALGVCGTDHEIVAGDYGWAPEGAAMLVLGHESLGRVLRAPAGCGLAEGDLVVGVVRRPDPVPCAACAGGEWDMCRNGLYTERGIKERDGYGAQHWTVDPAFAVKADPGLGFAAVLTEPASVVAKAWDQIERIGARSRTWAPRTLLVTGAGPVGLLAAMMGRQRGLETHVFDRVTTGAKPGLVSDLGATYHSGDLDDLGTFQPDIVVECTGADAVVAQVMRRAARDAIVCLTGVSSAGRVIDFDMGEFNRRAVLRNEVVFGSVNANRAHYEAAAKSLAKADRAWLSRLISRRVPLLRWPEAFERREGDVKVVIEFAGGVA